MSGSLSLYMERKSGLHRLNPVTKLTLSAAIFLMGLLLPGVGSTYALAAAAVVPLALWGRIARPLLGRTWRIVLPFAISVFLIQGLFWHGGAVLVSLGPLSLKQEGVLFAARATGRIVVVVMSFLLLSLATRPDALMIALSQRGLPATITYIILATIQIVPRFQDRAATIIDAQKSRGLETGGSIRNRIGSILPLVGPLILRSIMDAEQRAIALEARGFNRSGAKTSILSIEDSSGQRVLRVVCLVLVLGAAAARVVLSL